MIFASFHQGEDASGRTTAVDLSAAARRQLPAQGAGGIWGEGSSRSAAWSSTHQAVLSGGKNILVAIWGRGTGLVMEEKARAHC